jgi:hypothetical protein
MFFKRPSNITPRDVINERLWVVLDVPYSLYRSASRAIGAAWKQALQKELMRRPYNEDRPLCGIWQDECACWLTEKMDVEAAERGRASGMYHVNAYQSYSTIVNGYGGGAVGESRAKALLSNFNIHVICGQTDAETRLKDQQMIGSVATPMTTRSVNGKGGEEGGGWSESTCLQWLPSLPEDWMLGLEHGQNGYVQAFVFAGGRQFNWNAKRWLLVRWPTSYAWTLWQALTERVPMARGFWGYVSPKVAFNPLCFDVGRWWRFWTERRGHFRRGVGYRWEKVYETFRGPRNA